MKGEVLKLLREQDDDFLSGEKISESLGCSRTAVWKHIRALKHEGYQIEAIRNKGYRLNKSVTSLSEHDVYSRIHDNDLFHRIVYYDTVSSTQTEARRIAYEESEEGIVVAADEQTEGKGRLGRKWDSQKGTGIWMSLIVKPEVEFRHAPQITLLTAVAVSRAIEKETSLTVTIKWPNDLLINGKKICGILTEMQADPDRILSVIVGIGLNVNQRTFTGNYRYEATSLSNESGEVYNRAELIASILDEFAVLYKLYLSNGFLLIKPLWEAHAETIGKKITVKTVRDTIKGKALGINDDGALLLEDEKGTVHPVYSADIETE